jgi:hypothetical protein
MIQTPFLGKGKNFSNPYQIGRSLGNEQIFIWACGDGTGRVGDLR